MAFFGKNYTIHLDHLDKMGKWEFHDIVEQETPLERLEKSQTLESAIFLNDQVYEDTRNDMMAKHENRVFQELVEKGIINPHEDTEGYQMESEDYDWNEVPSND